MDIHLAGWTSDVHNGEEHLTGSEDDDSGKKWLADGVWVGVGVLI